MPRAARVCSKIGCPEVVVGDTYCPTHKPAAWAGVTQRSKTKTYAARKRRAWILRRDPVCVCGGCKACTPTGCSAPSAEDDHIIPLAEGGTDAPLSNHQALCAQCHKVKSLAESRRGRDRTR